MMHVNWQSLSNTLTFRFRLTGFSSDIILCGSCVKTQWKLRAELWHLQTVFTARQKCMKALNLIRVTSNAKWRRLRLYCSLIRSKLDYGCIVYGSSRKSYLQMLDPIQNQALHLCLGAFRTSPASSLLVEANEMPLDIIAEGSQHSTAWMSHLTLLTRLAAVFLTIDLLNYLTNNQIRLDLLVTVLGMIYMTLVSYQKMFF